MELGQTLLEPGQALKIYAVCCVILFLKMLLTGITQAAVRAKTKSYLTPEDAKMIAKSDPVTQEPVELIRCNNALRNDFENIPIFLFMALCYVMLNCWDKGSLIYFGTFTFARIFHTIFYIRGVQPARSLAYFLGLIMSFSVAGHIIYQIFIK